MHILEREWLTTDDVLLCPKLGKLQSRSQAKLHPFIYSAPMDTVTGAMMADRLVELGEYPVICRYLEEDYRDSLVRHANNPNVWFTVGNVASLEDWLRLLDEADAKAGGLPTDIKISVAVDIAHGDSLVGLQVVALLRDFPFVGQIMSGSICTADAAARAVSAGCSHLRVGVGPGHACSTRIMTGCGLPNLSAVYRIWQRVATSSWADEPIQIIADGGIREPGDVVKYLAAGAHGCMLGKVLASTYESPGWYMTGPALGGQIIDPSWNGDPRTLARLVKRFRGQSSAEFQLDQFGKANQCPEGVTGPEIEPTGYLSDILSQYRGGVASAVSYLGLEQQIDIQPENCEFVRITPNGMRESRPQI